MPEILKHGGQNSTEELKEIFNIYLEMGQIPESWIEAEIITIHKKGDITKHLLQPYRSAVSNVQLIYENTY